MVLTYRTGAAGAPANATRMADYYGNGLDIPELARHLARYLGEHFGSEVEGGVAAVPMRDMHPLIAAALGIDPTRAVRTDEMARLLSGRRADGLPIPGKEVHRATARSAPIAYTDFTFSAPKSFSVALVMAKTEAERNILESCFMRANEALMKHVASQIGQAQQGHSGRHGTQLGHMAVVAYHHYTSRPALKLPVVENGVEDTEFVVLPDNVTGDMNRHAHNIFFHAAAMEDGRVMSPNLDEIRERLHEWGGIGHAYLSTYLQEYGVSVGIDPRHGLSALTDVPREVCKLFQGRGDEGEHLARQHAAGLGLDWDAMDPAQRRRLIDTKIAISRQAKGDGKGDYAAWMKRARDAGYEHRTVLRPGRERFLAEPGEQIKAAYDAGLPMLAAEFARRSVVDGATLRATAARSLIVPGIRSPADVALVTEAYRTEGVMQDGTVTPLLWVREDGKRYASVTTGLHVAQEAEAIGLLRAAAADTSGSLTHAEISEAVARVAAAKGYDFTSPHGCKQLAMAEALAMGGRAIVGIGAAGAGKTTLIEPVIEGYHAKGWQSFGVTLAWRQTHDLQAAGVRKRRKSVKQMEPDTSRLRAAGIDQNHALALTPFLKAAAEGSLALDAKTLVVVDEIATLGTKAILELARLQAVHGFKLVGLGDPEQCQAIDAGNAVALFRHALGERQVPAILDTIRQKREADRETAKLFREGKAAEALARKDAAGLLHVIPGGYADAITAGVDEWERRQAANADRPDYRLGLTVPTNADAQAVGVEIRRRHRAAGIVKGPEWQIAAVDQAGTQSEIALAVGDRVRLFDRVNARYSDASRGYFGENGTTADVVSIDAEGLRLRRADGKVGAIRWASLQDPDTARVRLSYGHALTIDARQGATLTDHITLLPAGTQAITAYKAYPADTRNREDSVFVVSHGAEKDEVRGRRPLGDPWLATASDAQMRASIIENMARNLSRKPEKLLATDFLERATEVHEGAVRSQRAVWFREQAAAEPEAAPVVPLALGRPQQAEPGGPAPMSAAERIKRAREARRATRPPAQRPKKAKEKPTMEPHQAQAEFADELRRAGVIIRGEPKMDGKWHNADRINGRGQKRAASYLGHLDGTPNGIIRKFNEPDIKWVAKRAVKGATAEDRRAREARQVQREAERIAAQTRAGKRAFAIWKGAKPARGHPYLERKGVEAHGMRLDKDGNLVLPLRDAAGYLHNVQRIPADPVGKKLFLPGGRVDGLFATLGEPVGNRPIIIGEGFATVATVRQATGFPAVVAFNANNLLAVTQALRVKFPDAPIVIAADNDHHLPRREVPLPNAGKEKAEAAAEAVGGIVLLPSFREADAGTDWNDWAGVHGPEALRVVLETRLAKEGIAMMDKEAMRPTQAQRDAARAADRSKAAAASKQQAAQAAQRAAQQAAERQKQRDSGKGL